MNSKALENIEEYRLNTLRNLLSQCTESQQKKFWRIFISWNDIGEHNLNNAITICERAVKQNSEKDNQNR